MPVMGRITINGQMAQFSCRMTVPAALWNPDTQHLCGHSRESQRLNEALDAIRRQINEHYQRLSERNFAVTAEQVKGALMGRDNMPLTLLSLFDRDLSDFEKRVGVDRSLGSLRILRVVRKHLSDFLRLRYGRSDIQLKELTAGFIRAFSLYLQGDLHLSSASVWCYVSPLKRLVGHAHEDGLIRSNPFARFHVVPKVKERSFLTPEELQRFSLAQMPNRDYAFVRDLFVFSCWTGLSFIDIAHLGSEELVEVDGRWWIIGHRQKTHTLYQTKLLEVPLRILERYRQPAGPLFPVFGYKRTSRMLQRVLEICGIEKPITFHCGRHTFATMALFAGMPIESVARVLGHTKISTTQIYAKITLKKLANDFQALESR